MNNRNFSFEDSGSEHGNLDYFPENFSLAVAYIPFQQWNNDSLYNPDTALVRGTIFKQLDKPWKGGCCS